MSEMTVSEARAALPEVLNRVQDGDEVTITRHGTAVAVVVRPDVLRVRRAEAAFREADRIGELLDDARRQPLPTRPGLSTEEADDLVEWVRQGRDQR